MKHKGESHMPLKTPGASVVFKGLRAKTAFQTIVPMKIKSRKQSLPLDSPIFSFMFQKLMQESRSPQSAAAGDSCFCFTTALQKYPSSNNVMMGMKVHHNDEKKVHFSL